MIFMRGLSPKEIIFEIQTWLHVLEYNIYPDGIYGAETVQAVKAFQAKNKIPINGIVDFKCWELMYTQYNVIMQKTSNPQQISPFNHSLEGFQISIGDNFKLVYIIQVMLETLTVVYDTIIPPIINGIYDNDTIEAVKNFQKSNHLPQTGVINKNTWDCLSNNYNKYVKHIDF